MATKLIGEIEVQLFSKHIPPGKAFRDNLITGKNHLIQANRQH